MGTAISSAARGGTLRRVHDLGTAGTSPLSRLMLSPPRLDPTYAFAMIGQLARRLEELAWRGDPLRRSRTPLRLEVSGTHRGGFCQAMKAGPN